MDVSEVASTCTFIIPHLLARFTQPWYFFAFIRVRDEQVCKLLLQVNFLFIYRTAWAASSAGRQAVFHATKHEVKLTQPDAAI